MKYNTIFLILLFITPILRAQTQDPSHEIESAEITRSRLFETEEQNSRRIIIATNLEDVLIAKNWLSIFSSGARCLLKAQNKGGLFKLGFIPSFWRDCYRAIQKKLVVDEKPILHKSEIISYLARTYAALSIHEDELFDMVHEYTIDEQMIAFYLWLKISKNYAIIIATNKNQASYECIKKKLDTDLRQKFGIGWDDLFDGAFYVDKLDPQTHQYFTSSLKPDSDYFLGLWRYIAAHGYTKENAYIMYIDDAEPNIIAAQATHHEHDIPIEGVYYQNPDQIKHAITLLGKSLEKSRFENIE